jgi:kynurenine formamidase
MTVTRANPPVSHDQLREKAQELRNWGRWGPDDEIGTLNLATPERVAAAARLVRSGAAFSLAIELGRGGFQRGYPPGRFNPVHVMYTTGLDAIHGDQGIKAQFSDDMFSAPLHGGTHWDSLSHVFFEGQMYNGHSAALVHSRGADRNGVEKIRAAASGRGVLLDFARWQGVEELEPGYGLTCAEFDRCAADQGVEIEPGDFVLVRTGQLGARLAAGEWGDYAGGDAPGPAFEVLDWCFERDIAALATDTWGVEVRPNQTDEVNVATQPFHHVAIPCMGLCLGEIFHLDELAADCAADGRYEFLLVTAPLPIVGASGSLINPIAFK